MVSLPLSTPKARSALGIDFMSVALIVFLAAWGIFSIASATQDTSHGLFSDTNKQIAFVVIGLSLMAGLTLLPFRWLLHAQGWIYAINLLCLVAVLVLPHSIAPEINGAKSWIRLGPISLQMSEFSKFALLLSLSAFWTRRQAQCETWRTLLTSLLYIAPPLLLILKQPDFGTAMAVLTIWLGVAYFAGARWVHLLTVCIVGSLLFTAAWRGGVLKRHQKERLAVFLDPKIDPRGAGYQLEQAQIAIGGGGATGQGYKHGLQNRAHYVPENQTDFIFTVVAEEWGFAGCILLLGCYSALLARTILMASETDNYFGVLLCGGFCALLAFHCLVNIGMNLRMMPVTGVPLPFFSYGGSSFVAFSGCAGLCQSVSWHRR